MTSNRKIITVRRSKSVLQVPSPPFATSLSSSLTTSVSSQSRTSNLLRLTSSLPPGRWMQHLISPRFTFPLKNFRSRQLLSPRVLGRLPQPRRHLPQNNSTAEIKISFWDNNHH